MSFVDIPTLKQKVNRFKANKGAKQMRQQKFVKERYMKHSKHVSLHYDSRSKNQFNHDDINRPDQILSRRQLYYDQHSRMVQNSRSYK